MKKTLRRFCSALLVCLCLTGLLAVPAAAAAPFPDVPASHWAASSIARAAELGLINGRKDGSFGLRQPMTRAAFVTALCRLFNWEMLSPAKGSYADNQDSSVWYYSAVETALANGALTEQAPDFRPDDSITREEIAVMLVRGLGYGTIAGLVQDLPVPFQDLTSNAGYISIAYELGLVSGTSATAFSPDTPATREQAAVFLMRVWDRLHAQAPGLCGVAASADGLDAAGLEAVAVPAVKLAYNGISKISDNLETGEIDAIRAVLASAGTKQLLYVSGDPSVLRSDSSETAYDIVSVVKQGNWDGVMLDVPNLGATTRAGYTLLTAALRNALPEGKLLYVVADGPVWQGDSPKGYDYAALGARADRLILRAASYNKRINGVSTAPLEPLEEVYYALAEVKDKVPSDRLSIWITTTGTTGGSSVMVSELAQILADPTSSRYYSERYGAAYLSCTLNDAKAVVWYQNGQSVQARRQLASFFGAAHFCLSNVSGPLNQTDGVLSALR